MRQADDIPVAAGVELLQGELADRLQHPEARLPLSTLGLANEALVDERGERGKNVEPVAGCISGLGRLQRPAAGEDRQPAKQRLLAGREQVVAPGDGVAQRLLARGQVAGAAGQQRQAPVQPRQQRRRRQHA